MNTFLQGIFSLWFILQEHPQTSGQPEHGDVQHEMQTLPLKKTVLIIICSFILLAIVIAITVQFVPITF